MSTPHIHVADENNTRQLKHVNGITIRLDRGVARHLLGEATIKLEAVTRLGPEPFIQEHDFRPPRTHTSFPIALAAPTSSPQPTHGWRRQPYPVLPATRIPKRRPTTRTTRAARDHDNNIVRASTHRRPHPRKKGRKYESKLFFLFGSVRLSQLRLWAFSHLDHNQCILPLDPAAGSRQAILPRPKAKSGRRSRVAPSPASLSEA